MRNPEINDELLKIIYNIEEMVIEHPSSSVNAYNIQTTLKKLTINVLINQSFIKKANRIISLDPNSKNRQIQKLTMSFIHELKREIKLENPIGVIDKKLLESKLSDYSNDLELHIKEAHDRIMGLGDNWDYAGSASFKEHTFKKTAEVVKKLLRAIDYDSTSSLPFPYITPGADGDIDISWYTKEYSFDLSVPESDNEVAAVYANDKRTRYELSIDFDPYEEIPLELIEWCKKVLL